MTGFCIKPLVWADGHQFGYWSAITVVGLYVIRDFGDSEIWCERDGETVGTWCETLELAKAAAQSDYADRITAALEPDPTPALGWKAMQAAAAERIKDHSNTARLKMRAAHEAEDVNDYDGWSAIVAHLDIAHDAILAMTGPTYAQLLAEAVRLLSRDALMVEGIDAVADACREFKIKPELFRAALAKIGEAK